MPSSGNNDNHHLTRTLVTVTIQQRSFILDRPIVLVGTMGAGKTSIGRRLAKKLSLPFFDSDLEIEAASGCTIIDFFERYGEQAFREGEAKIITRLVQEKPIGVIATGGGALKNETLRTTINASALTIWIRADIDTLVRRVARRNNRPLLNKGDPRQVLSRFSEDEALIYRDVDIAVNSHTDAVHGTVEATLSALFHFLSHTP